MSTWLFVWEKALSNAVVSGNWSCKTLNILLTVIPETQFQKRGERERRERENGEQRWREGRKKKENFRQRFRSHGPNNGSNQRASSHATVFHQLPNAPRRSSPRDVHVRRRFRFPLRRRWCPLSPPASSIIVSIRRLQRKSLWFVLQSYPIFLFFFFIILLIYLWRSDTYQISILIRRSYETFVRYVLMKS